MRTRRGLTEMRGRLAAVRRRRTAKGLRVDWLSCDRQVDSAGD